MSMERDRRPAWIWLALVALNALQSAYYWPRLPEVMAQHFGGAGEPNGWAPKQGFFGILGGLMLFTGALLFGLPKLMRRLPFALVNIPYKAYWAATPERQRAAWDMVEEQLNWAAVATAALLTAVVHLVIRANLGDGRLENAPFIATLVGFAGFMLGWAMSFLRRFRPPEGA